MYDLYDSESNGYVDLLVGDTKVADMEGGGDNNWITYRYYDVESYISTGDNIWILDSTSCCHTFDNLLFGWEISEAGGGADGSSSSSC